MSRTLLDPLHLKEKQNSTEEVEYLLKHSRESLDFALQSGRMGTWDLCMETGTIACSKEMLDLWGVKEEEFNNQRSPLQSKVHPEDYPKMVAAIDYAIKNKSIYELEYRIIPSPGVQRWVLSRGRCTFAPKSNLPTRFAGVVYDITERKAREEASGAAAKSRDQFFMIASHELKTPLTCLQLQIQVMEWELKQDYSKDVLAGKIESGLKKQQEHLLRISRIIDNILDETKITEGRLSLQLEQFDLGEMVKEVLEQFKVTAKISGVEIYFSSIESVLGTWDRFRLEQVLLNLLMNAIRYGNKKPIYVEVRKDAQQALMVVRDEGIGIKLEDQSRVFERFERAISDKEINGMGLGLFISNNIVRDQGGEIRLKSEVGKGSEFMVVLPCHLKL